MLNNVDFRDVQELAKCDKVKIVACDGKSKYTYKIVKGDALIFHELNKLRLLCTHFHHQE